MGSGHRELGKRRGDEPVQFHLTEAGHEVPWFDAVADPSVEFVRIGSGPVPHVVVARTDRSAGRHQAACCSVLRLDFACMRVQAQRAHREQRVARQPRGRKKTSEPLRQ